MPDATYVGPCSRELLDKGARLAESLLQTRTPRETERFLRGCGFSMGNAKRAISLAKRNRDDAA